MAHEDQEIETTGISHSSNPSSPTSESTPATSLNFGGRMSKPVPIVLNPTEPRQMREIKRLRDEDGVTRHPLEAYLPQSAEPLSLQSLKMQQGGALTAFQGPASILPQATTKALPAPSQVHMEESRRSWGINFILNNPLENK
jgi:hypothetical protein